ncbi:hypothetical protein [Mammaliicoccus sciuri]|uniref:hypothetical protein n=1 Tax=Mammaliicoccus sciuri TaxID=1296 RepID=UPI001FB2E687|nr:hypothetical protein [Mammaliicoccus sciuri]MCJ0951566.1 hypothetical protein [Mammaliicoccus sciuri]
MLRKILISSLLCSACCAPALGKVYAEESKDIKPVKYVFKEGNKESILKINSDGSITIPGAGGTIDEAIQLPTDLYISKNVNGTKVLNPKYKHIWDQWEYFKFYRSKDRVNDLFIGEHPRPLDGVTFVPNSHKKSDNLNNVNNNNDDKKANDQKEEPKSDLKEPNKNITDDQSKSDQPKQDVPTKVEQSANVDNKSDDQNNVANKKVADNEKPVKYVFKSGGKASAIEVNYDGSMTIPEPGGDLWDVDVKPVDFYITKNGVQTNEVNPKYKHIWDQWAYYDFYASKGRTADLFVGEHPRPLDGVTFVPKSDKTSDNQKEEPKSDQQEPNKNTTDNQSKSDQPKQDVPAKVEQPVKDNAKVDKKSDSQSNVVDKKDTDDQNKVVSDNKAVADNQKSEPQSSDVSKKDDVKKEDNNKDVKAKSSDNKAKSADNKSDKQQKELPKTGESDSTWLRNGLVILSAFIVLVIYRLSRKYEV